MVDRKDRLARHLGEVATAARDETGGVSGRAVDIDLDKRLVRKAVSGLDDGVQAVPDTTGDGRRVYRVRLDYDHAVIPGPWSRRHASK
jgi:hypothetical protein